MIVSDHQRIDQRSIALHRAIAEKIRREPALLNVAIQQLERWKRSSHAVSAALCEWEEILAKPLEEILSLLVETSERMTRLRQSSPFGGILTTRERWDIYESYATGAYYSRSRHHF